MATPPLAEAPKRADLAHLKKDLLSRRQELLSDVRCLELEEAATAGTGSGSSIHSVDLGSDRAAHEVSLGRMESEIEELREIDEALGRIGEGSFGLCEACGNAIGLKRLKAIPYAKLCLPCKRTEEAL